MFFMPAPQFCNENDPELDERNEAEPRRANDPTAAAMGAFFLFDQKEEVRDFSSLLISGTTS